MKNLSRIGILLLAALFQDPTAQDEPPKPPAESRSKLHEPPAPLPRGGFGLEGRSAEIWDAIAAEAAAMPEHSWAGRYYTGDGLGMNVSLVVAPKAGFLWYWTGCLGMYGLNHGPASVNDRGQLVLHPVKSRAEQGMGVGTVYWPVKWGQHRFLVKSGMEEDFAELVISGRVRFGRVPPGIFDGRPKGAAALRGAPTVPAGLAAMLAPRPIEAVVTAVGASEEVERAPRMRRTRVTLNKGREEGVRADGWLVGDATVFFPSSGGAFERLKIDYVDADSSRGWIEQDLLPGEERPLPQAGQVVTTGWPTAADVPGEADDKKTSANRDGAQ